jgi:hypothetical protein
MTAAGLVIEYTTTADMPDGQSLPPFIDKDGAVWGVVRRLPGARTRWRRIRPSQTKRLSAAKSRSRSTTGGTHDKARRKEGDNGHAKARRRNVYQGR